MPDRDRTEEAASDAKRLRIVHVLRAPVGGLFRHVVDLASAQAERGHLVGVVADSSTGGERADEALRALEPSLALGLTRLPMRRLPALSDPLIAYRIAAVLSGLSPDVIHGHGAKGGLYARLPALLPLTPKSARPAIRVYTPHGGSLHFGPEGIVGRLYLLVERALGRVTDVIPFESDYVRQRFASLIGPTNAAAFVVPNGLRPEEFEPIVPAPDAADFLYVGEWRSFKGVDTLVEALALLRAREGWKARLTLVGSGPDEAALRALAQRLDVADRLSFATPRPVREALRLGRVLVVPSRAESLPYIVLEAIAAHVPIIATQVGGIPQIFGPWEDRLVPSDDPAALARAMIETSRMSPEARMRLADALAGRVRDEFSLAAMIDAVLRSYVEAIELAGTRRSGSASLSLQGL